MLPAVTSQEVLHVHATLVSQEMEQLAQVQNEVFYAKDVLW